MSVIDLTRIDRSIDINASPERVYRALTDAAEVAEWFRMKVDGPLVEGRETWMTTAPEHGNQRFVVKVVKLSPPRSVVWQWHPGAIDPNFDYSKEPMTTVTFTIEPAGGGTRLTVSETGFDLLALDRRAKAHADNTQGWTEVTGWLKTYVEAKN
jgi:uncharacterized protein YndB with AHSA1/START domain